MRSMRECRGNAAVEFAIIAPVFIFLVMGMLAYGIYLGAVHSVQQLAADAARAAVAGIDETERRDLSERFIRLNGDAYVLLKPEFITVRVGGSADDPNQFVVAVSYDASHLPVWSLYDLIPLPEKTIVRSSTIRVGGV